ncbi:MAG: peptidase M4 family protein, partial [candidate division Zixibacteria bacterium]|nr:peptidase M4 family protein [candidate division Zixibacteria bacterium]
MKKIAQIIVLVVLAGPIFEARAGKFSDPPSYKSVRVGQVDSTEVVRIARRLKSLISPAAAKSGTNTGAFSLSQAMKKLGANPISLPVPGQKGLTIHSHIKTISTNGTPGFISNLETLSPQLSVSRSNPGQKALEFITEYSDVFRLENPIAELVMLETKTDKLGHSHVFFEQTYLGIPYWKKSLNAHFLPDGTLSSINARYAPSPKQIDPQSVTVDSALALSIAQTSIEKITAFVSPDGLPDWMAAEFEPRAAKYIWTNEIHTEPRIVWHVELRPNIIDWWFVFVDAATGAILEEYNNTQTDGPAIGSGFDLNGVNRTVHSYLQTGTFYMIDASKPSWVSAQTDPVGEAIGGLVTLDLQFTDNGPAFYVTSANNNNWSDAVSVSAHFNVGTAFDYFFHSHGRLSIDGNGGRVFSIIHVTENGLGWDNAGWSGALNIMIYGDGNLLKPFAGALDIAAHEMTHGVIDHTVDLVYRFQPGALNESICDVFAVLIDSSNWTLGEDIVLPPAFPSGAMRDLRDPHNGGLPSDLWWQPAHMSEFLHKPLSDDHGGVHGNSGITNHAAYLIGQALGREKLGLIYYRILDAGYLNPQSEFVDMRIAAIRSASDLFGPLSVEVIAVKNSFDAVGIFDGQLMQPPTDREPRIGESKILVLRNEFDGSRMYVTSPEGKVFDPLTPTLFFSGSGKSFDVLEDGSFVLFVDDANFIRAVNVKTKEETVVSVTGEWRSLAVSPDGTKLAATSIYEDSLIWIFDFAEPVNSKSIHLYNPTTAEGVKSFTTRFADALDWNSTGETILYDALNTVPGLGGGTSTFWSIYLLDVADEVIIDLVSPVRDGAGIGNPSFAQLNDRYAVVDVFRTDSCASVVVGLDFFTGDAELIFDGGCVNGSPNSAYSKY